MEKSTFEQMGGTYREVNGYLIPNLVPPESPKLLGIWGIRHNRYLQEHRRAFHNELRNSGKLISYLCDINWQAEKMLSLLTEQMSEKEGVTEALKAKDQMEWVRRMDSIRIRATEIVNSELIYT